MPRKPVKKWNPKYTKTSVKMVLQDVLLKRSCGDLTGEDKTIIKEVLMECDKIAQRKEQDKKDEV
jgi:hypothetical protein|tara:strand:- start:125 stop:319 length:195 start_codon:yes stop_codon:yes gene_type:complete